MKIVVFGAEGQVGCELVASLGSRFGPSYPEGVVSSGRGDLDLADTSSISKYLNRVAPSFIVNAAAYTAVDMAESDREKAYLINHRAVAEMAHYCKQSGCHLIHISTDYVFDGDSDRAYNELDPAAPTGVYGASKLAGEIAIRDILEEFIILRVSWVFSVRGSNFVRTMLRLANVKEVVGVVGDQFGAPTSARGVASCISEIILKLSDAPDKARYWGTYHYSGFPFVSWADFAKEIFIQSRGRGLLQTSPKVREISSIDFPTPAARPANSKLDCSKIKNAFGIEPDDWKQSLGLVLDEIAEAATA